MIPFYPQTYELRSKGIDPLIQSFSLFVCMRGKLLNKSVLLEFTDIKQACQGNTNLSEGAKKPLWQPVLAVIKNYSTSTKKVGNYAAAPHQVSDLL